MLNRRSERIPRSLLGGASNHRGISYINGLKRNRGKSKNETGDPGNSRGTVFGNELALSSDSGAAVSLFGLITHLKDVGQGSGQDAGRRKSGAYTAVCEYFEPTRNAAMEP